MSAVYLDGATLSALLFSYLNSCGSQYGFLIGEKIEHIEDRISDSQILTHDVNSYIYISSFVPWPSQENIYSRGGHFRDEWIKHNFANKEHAPVGWYSFRHNTSTRPSLREITLHNSLSTSKEFVGQANDFLFFLCTSSFSSNMSTHTCTHGFMHAIDGHLVAVPMAVMNLGDTTRKEYKKRSNIALSHSKTVQESLHSFRRGFLKSSGELEQISKMNHLATSINKTLMSIHNKVFESEAALGLLETDTSILRQRLQQIEQEEIIIAQTEAEKRQNERDEARRKQDEEERAEEQEQLEKLLIDLGISSSDNSVGASSSLVPGQHFTASFPVEHYLNDEDIGSFQVVDLAPSVPIEHTYRNSNDRNKECAPVNVFSETQTKQTVCKQRSVTRSKANTREVNRPQTVKDKVSEAFSFLDEELNLKKVAAPQRKRAAHLQTNKSVDTAKVPNETDDKELVVDTHEVIKSTGKSDVSDTRKSRTKVVKNCPLVKDMTDNVNATYSDVMVEESNGVPH